MSVILVKSKNVSKRVRRKVFSIFVFFVAIFLAVNPVFALSNTQYEVYSNNDIFFYSPCTSKGTSGTTPGGSSNGGDVLVIGDSISTDVYGGGEIKEALPNSIVDAVGSSGINYDGHNAQGEPIRSGINRLKDHLSELETHNILVFAMGTNGGVSENDINALMDTVSGENVKIILMTIFNPSAESQVSNSNAMVKKTADEYDNVTYMDWYSVASQDPDKYVAKEAAMQVHPSQEGQKKFAEIMKNAVDKVTNQRSSALDSSSEHFYVEQHKKWGDITGWDHWDGSCSSVDAYDEFLSKRVDTLISIGAETGVPWETLAAQSIVESGAETSAVALKCNNPLGLTGTTPTACPVPGSNTAYYQQFATFEDAYRAYGENTWIIKKALSAGNYASSPYSIVEYMQYGEDYGYAMCGSDADLYENCKGFKGKPTPGYVSAASKRICGIQKWAVEHGKAISEENYSNYDTPYITNRTTGSGSISTTSKAGFSVSCNQNVIGGSRRINNGVTISSYEGHNYAFPIESATKNNYLGNSNENLKPDYLRDCSYVDQETGKLVKYDCVSVLSDTPNWYHHGCSGASCRSVDLGIMIQLVDGHQRTPEEYNKRYNTNTFSGSELGFYSTGAKVVAVAPGTITLAGEYSGMSECKEVKIKNDDGYPYQYFYYTHLSMDDKVSVGQHVDIGQVIGEVGPPRCTGNGSQGHLHLDTSQSTKDNISPLIETLYQALPKDADELAKRETQANAEDSGMTYEQAKQFMVNYGTNRNGSSEDAVGSHSWELCGGGGSNCVTFSSFFINKFSSISGSDLPDGRDVVDTLRGRGADTGYEPRVWAVFSWDGGEYGHTGVILGYQDGKWIVGHASCTRGEAGERGSGDGTKDGGGSGVVEMNSDIIKAIWGSGATNIKYAYLDEEVDVDAISDYLSSGV